MSTNKEEAAATSIAAAPVVLNPEIWQRSLLFIGFKEFAEFVVHNKDSSIAEY